VIVGAVAAAPAMVKRTVAGPKVSPEALSEFESQDRD
jgi:hypothetical protein